jgi:hypothetical protein
MGGFIMDVFDVFQTVSYDFLKISRGGRYGNVIESITPATGVFKLRDGMASVSNQETRESTATLHVRPNESFLAGVNDNMVGHGIRVDDQDYSILQQTGGMNYHNGELEHYRLTLQRADYSDYEETS